MADSDAVEEVVTCALSLVSSSVAADEGTSLKALGITSLLLFEFVTLLEERTAIEIPDDELTPANFATVGDVAALIERVRSADPQG